ncbi:hypothetical protein EXIGLDRAFT_728935 [Exidia glandulosa HHB12029]|uniref:BHLH domain-containing protein n=1 Tax=Exidia glandulosa HHB12029 TaxID=1314781 RepID=A0A165LNP3_EXIGL|nr:hypothetical protein EXIGLDRAFT_728935 [Exidia glandulosa HHB12029]
MDYNGQQQDFTLDLGTFDLSDFVNSTTSHELGDLFSGNPGSGNPSEQSTQQQSESTSQHQNYASGSSQQAGSSSDRASAPGQLSAVQHLLNSQGGQASASDLGITPAMLKERLEQHIKIQQIQQLQTQLLQQQIDVMLRATHGAANTSQNAFQGLPTPAASSELPPTNQADLLSSMSPMFLQEMFMNPQQQSGSINPDAMLRGVDLPSFMQNPTMSAPAALAFQTSPPVAEYELSPLWLPQGSTVAPQSSGRQTRAAHLQQQQQAASGSSTKRARRNSDVEDAGARKRPPVGRSVLPNLAASSPAKRKTPPGARRRSIVTDGALPSPIDAQSQMLPPPPKDISSASSMSSVTSVDTPHNTSVSPDIAPVTPAGIMGLGPLRSGLIPPSATDDPSSGRRVTRKRDSASAKSKAPTTPQTPATGPGSGGKPKTILPTGGTPILPPQPQPPLHVRKSSHKVAEQKRRDSLKISFDDLRLLLPPIPVNLDDAERDEPLLPGAMPPRGPPRGEGDGPNRAVSKLALLRCGNEYIRELKWKVNARDEEIVRLRSEVARMRSAFEAMGLEDAGGAGPDGELLDLSRDLDAEYDEVRKAAKAARLAARRELGDIDDEDEDE